MNDTTDRDLHEPRARRYAQALASAAAAEQRIAELVDQLSEHEWLRSQAESQVSYLRERLDLGDHQLIAGTDDPPPLDVVNGLIDLGTGRAWVRAMNGATVVDSEHWVAAEASERGQTRYSWPIQDAGPFIALPDAWHLTKINRDARARDEREDKIRDTIRDLPGYRSEEDNAWARPELSAAVSRVLVELARSRSNTLMELQDAQRRIRELELKVEQLEAGERS